MTHDYWNILVNKYFEAETTPEEERRLRRFLAETDDPAFDDVRAVMGFLSVRKERHAAEKGVRRWTASVAVAASLILLSVLGLNLAGRDDCVMYAYGEKTTDRTVVMNDVSDILTDLFSDDQGPDVAGQLTELFN